MSSVSFEVNSNSVRLLREGGESGTSCAAILSLLLGSSLLNSIVLLAIVKSSLHSASFFYLLLVFACFTHLLESALNMSVACLAQSSWTDLYKALGPDWLKSLCRGNAAFMQLTAVLQSFYVCMLSFQRSTAMNTTGSGLSFNGPLKPDERVRIRIAVFAAFVGAFVLVLPLIAGVGECRFFYQRNSCSPTHMGVDAGTMVAAIVLLVLGTAIPSILAVQQWLSILLKLLNEKKRLELLEMRAMNRAATHGSPSRGMGSPLGVSLPSWSQIWGDDFQSNGGGFQNFIATIALVSTHAIMVLPSSIYSQTTQFYETYAIQIDQSPFRPMGPTSLPTSLQPLSTPAFDATLTWFRFLYSLISPVVILLACKDIRSQTVYFLMPWRKNQLVSPHGSETYRYFLPVRKKGISKRRRSKRKGIDSSTTPILFVSDEGVHLRFTTKTLQEVCVMADVSSRGGVTKSLQTTRILESPSRPSIRPDVTLLEEDELDDRANKPLNSKTVRFSQRVSEIPVSSAPSPSNEFLMDLRSEGAKAPPATPLRPDLGREVFKRRASDTITRLTGSQIFDSLSNSTSSLLPSIRPKPRPTHGHRPLRF